MGAVLNNQRIAPFFKVYSEFLSRKEATCDAKVKRIQQVRCRILRLLLQPEI